MNDLGFDIDETDFDAQSRGVGVDAARPILLACFTKLVDEALTYHTLDAQAQAYRQYRQMINAQRPGETLHEYWWRVWYGPDGMWSAARAPVVPAPAQSGIRNTTGGGKSTAFRQVIAARYIPEAKRLQLPHRVLIAVPTHKLAAEARTKMPDGVTVAIWQGLKATKLGTNEPMCLNHAAVDAALALGSDVETTACRRGQRGGPPIVCPFYEGHGQCHYQAQKAEALAADVLFVAHEGLFQMPPGVCDGFGLVIIDESFWQKGLSGARDDNHPQDDDRPRDDKRPREDNRPRLAIAGLCEEFKDFPVRVKAGQDCGPKGGKAEAEAPKGKPSKREARRRRKALKRGEKALRYGREALKRERKKPAKRRKGELAKREKRELAKRRVVSEKLTEVLREITGKLQAACAASPDGYVTRERLEAAALNRGSGYQRARWLEWLRKVDHGIKPNASVEQLKDAVKRFGFLAQIKQRVALWHAVGELFQGNEEATGRLRIETVTTKEGSIRWLYTRGADASTSG